MRNARNNYPLVDD